MEDYLYLKHQTQSNKEVLYISTSYLKLSFSLTHHSNCMSYALPPPLHSLGLSYAMAQFTANEQKLEQEDILGQQKWGLEDD